MTPLSNDSGSLLSSPRVLSSLALDLKRVLAMSTVLGDRKDNWDGDRYHREGRPSFCPLILDNQWSVPLVGSKGEGNESHDDYGSKRHGWRRLAWSFQHTPPLARGPEAHCGEHKPSMLHLHASPWRWCPLDLCRVTAWVNIYMGSFTKQFRIMRKTTSPIYPDPLEISLQSLFCLPVISYLYEIHITKLTILK